MSEELFRVGVYIGVLLGVGYVSVFGPGWHVWLLAALCVVCVAWCGYRAAMHFSAASEPGESR